VIWKVEWEDQSRRELRKLNKELQQNILRCLREKIATKDDPRRFGKPLSYDKHGLWQYRVQDARIICRIFGDELLVLVVKVGHRKNVYS
jgi:mRNA interferase RelE/StbE